MNRATDPENPQQQACKNENGFTFVDNPNTRSEFWKIPAEYWTAQEKERCDAWIDEVQNLLVFSGLFSAVVTGLLIDSYKSLQENPSEVYLAQIAANLAAIANGSSNAATLSPQSTTSFTPSSTSVRVNSFWFLSLILSLATALVAIVAQQWLREHLRPSTRNVPIRVLPGLLHMQAEALDRYWVPQTFTALSLLLITGLILFLVGMIEFLWDLNRQVAIPGIIAIAFILIFLVYTTVRPGLQHRPATGRAPRSPNELPTSPCPYKSPQSWAFLRLITFSKTLPEQLVSAFRSAVGLRPTKDDEKPWLLDNRERMCRSWIDNAMLWLSQRDIDLLAHRPGRGDLLELASLSDFDALLPKYDAVKSLLKIRDAFSLTGSADLSTLFCCFNDFTTFRGIEIIRQKELAQYIYDIAIPDPSLHLPRDSIQQIDSDAPSALLIDTLRLSFMGQNQVEPIYDQVKMAIGVVDWIIEHIDVECDMAGGSLRWASMMTNFLSSCPNDEQLQYQILHLIETFFAQAASLQPSQDDLGKRLHTTTYVSCLLCAAVAALSRVESEQLLARHRELFGMIRAKILDSHQPASDYLFATVVYYATQIMHSPLQDDGLLCALGMQKARLKNPFVLAMLNHIYGVPDVVADLIITHYLPSGSNNALVINTSTHQHQTSSSPSPDIPKYDSNDKSEGFATEKDAPFIEPAGKGGSQEVTTSIEIECSQDVGSSAKAPALKADSKTSNISNLPHREKTTVIDIHPT